MSTQTRAFIKWEIKVVQNEKQKNSMWIFFIFLMNYPSLCRHRLGHSLGKNIKLHEMKNKKKQHGFSYHKNMANFEAFLQDKNFSKYLSFLMSMYMCTYMLPETQVFWLCITTRKIGFFGYITRRRSATSSSFVQVVNYFQLSLLPISTFS